MLAQSLEISRDQLALLDAEKSRIEAQLQSMVGAIDTGLCRPEVECVKPYRTRESSLSS